MQSVSPTLSRRPLNAVGRVVGRMSASRTTRTLIQSYQRQKLSFWPQIPAYVAQHRFYPFLRYEKRWNWFAEKGGSGKEKKRLIRYAARLDLYIFSNYRHILSEHYEAELARLGLEANVLAYRRIALGDGLGGKCNIHFAHEAFAKVRQLGKCCAIALDISSFFELLDHARLKALWCRLLGVDPLPEDHFQVFKAITRYSFVDKQAAYERLGHFGYNTGPMKW